MKIAAIAKVIKDRGSCRLYRVHGSDDLETKFYIGTNSEIYSLEGFPKPWSEAEVMTICKRCSRLYFAIYAGELHFRNSLRAGFRMR